MLVEINPLIVTPDGEVRALDSKVTIDDNALYRHPDIAEMRDVAAADPQEQMAREKGVTYVKLDGEVGILGNGAGPRDVARSTSWRRRAAARPTSSTSAAARRRRRSSTRSRSSSPTRRCARSCSTSSAASRAATRSPQGILDALDRPRHRRADRRAPRRHLRRGGPQAPGRREPARRLRRAHHARRRPARRRARRGGCLMPILVDRRDAARGAGHHRPRGLVPRHAQPRLRHGRGGRRDARQGRAGRQRHPGVRHRRAGRRAGRAPTPSMVFVPPRFAADAIYEAVDAGCETVICITEGIPAHDMLDVYAYVRARGVTLLGPELPGRALARGRQRSGSSRRRSSSRARSASSRAPAR